MIVRRLSLAAAAALVGTLCAAAGQEPPPPRAPAPREAGPAPEQPPKPVQAPANPEAEGPTTLRSPIPGEVTVISVAAGKAVKKGDVLVVLDDSGLLDAIDDARIKVDRVEAAFKAAEIDRYTAEAAVEEYRQGTLDLELKEIEGRIALAESRQDSIQDEVREAGRNHKAAGKEFERTTFEKLRSSEARLRDAHFGLQSATMHRKILKEFTAPRKVKELEGVAKKALAEELAASSRLELMKARLTRLQKLRADCRVKAPADGTFRPEVEEGDAVKFHKRLGRFEPSAAPDAPKEPGA